MGCNIGILIINELYLVEYRFYFYLMIFILFYNYEFLYLNMSTIAYFHKKLSLFNIFFNDFFLKRASITINLDQNFKINLSFIKDILNQSSQSTFHNLLA